MRALVRPGKGQRARFQGCRTVVAQADEDGLCRAIAKSRVPYDRHADFAEHFGSKSLGLMKHYTCFVIHTDRYFTFRCRGLSVSHRTRYQHRRHCRDLHHSVPVAPQAQTEAENLNRAQKNFQSGYNSLPTEPMGNAQASETTQLLRSWADGNRAALEQLTPRVYKELQRIAGHCMQNERSGRSLQTTALVHEAYLKLIDVTNVDWQHRAHFYAISAQIMRRILLDRARRRIAAKRGGAMPKVNLDELPELGSGRARELIALDDALTTLAEIDPRKERVVELRFFGGLSVDETAEVLKVSADTVLRDWRLARAWLLAELGGRSPSEQS